MTDMEINLAIALKIIANWPITDPADMDAVNMSLVAKQALKREFSTTPIQDEPWASQESQTSQ